MLEAADGAAALSLLDGSRRPTSSCATSTCRAWTASSSSGTSPRRELAGAVIIASGLDAKVIHAVQTVGESYGLQVLGAIEKPLTARCLGDLLAAYRPASRARRALPSTSGGTVSITARERRSRGRRRAHHVHLQPAVDVATGRVDRRCSPAAGTSRAGWVPPPTSCRPSSGGCSLEPARHRAEPPSRTSATSPRRPAPTCRSRSTSSPNSLHDAAARATAPPSLERRSRPGAVTFALDERDFRPRPGAGARPPHPPAGQGVRCRPRRLRHRPRPRRPRCAAFPLTEVQLAPPSSGRRPSDPRRARCAGGRVDVRPRGSTSRRRRRLRDDDDLQLPPLGLGCDRVPAAGSPTPMAGDGAAATGLAAWDPDRSSRSAG